jgi:hypothetical protein
MTDQAAEVHPHIVCVNDDVAVRWAEMVRYGPGGKSGDTRFRHVPRRRDRPSFLPRRRTPPAQTDPMIDYVTARFPENRKERVTKRRAMVDRLHTFTPPDSRMRLRLVGETFGRWRRERDGVARVLEIVDRSEVGHKLVVQRESDREQLSVRQVETLFVPDLGAHPMIELLSAELVEEFSMNVLRDGGLYVCRYIDGTTTVSKHGYVRKTKPRWKGAARDWFVRTGGMEIGMLREAERRID